MSNRLYKRSMSLTLARGQVGTYVTQPNNAIIITDLRVTFTIEKTISKEPDTANIAIYNLSERTRSEFQKHPLWMRLDVGYDGVLKRLFSGDIRLAQSRRERPNWVTELQCGDGERAIKFARNTRSYKAGTDVKTVLGDLASSMGMKIPTSISDAREFADQFVNGVTLSGPSQDQMTDMLKRYGMDWNVQDNQLQILRDSDTAGRAYLISPDNGMIETPTMSAPSKPGEPPRLVLDCLVYPELKPGALLQVRSETVNGYHKITKVTHTGDTHGEPWTTNVEAIPL